MHEVLSLFVALANWCSDDFATVLLSSLAGLDLSLWALAERLLPPFGDPLNALLLG